MIRFIDILLSAVLLFVLAPVLVLCAFAVIIDSGPPVLYRATRAGIGAMPIEVLKFRSMRLVKGGPSITAEGDDRITSVGRLLRSTKLDELPQLINVIRGDMSLVGPRPEDPRYVAMFPVEFAEILTVRPGITGVASIAYRNEEKLLASTAEPERYYVDSLLPAKLRLERAYLEDRSVRTNIRILRMTLGAVVHKGP